MVLEYLSAKNIALLGTSHYTYEEFWATGII